MTVFKLTSCMAANADSTARAIAIYLGHQLTVPTEFVDHIPWQEREYWFDRGNIPICWICGLPYVWKADEENTAVELLAAPVPLGDRYQGKPVYFSDVVVRQDSPYQTFADLRGTIWAYNEPRSHSGYCLTRYHLATLGETAPYFAKAVESGAHQTSLQWLLAGNIDATAIDSTVLETELRRDPGLATRIRILDTFGPSPSPPWVVHKTFPPSLKETVRSLLLAMHTDPEGSKILREGAIARFAAVQDADYDSIRHMARQAERISL